MYDNIKLTNSNFFFNGKHFFSIDLDNYLLNVCTFSGKIVFQYPIVFKVDSYKINNISINFDGFNIWFGGIYEYSGNFIVYKGNIEDFYFSVNFIREYTDDMIIQSSCFSVEYNEYTLIKDIDFYNKICYLDQDIKSYYFYNTYVYIYNDEFSNILDVSSILGNNSFTYNNNIECYLKGDKIVIPKNIIFMSNYDNGTIIFVDIYNGHVSDVYTNTTFNNVLSCKYKYIDNNELNFDNISSIVYVDGNLLKFFNMDMFKEVDDAYVANDYFYTDIGEYWDVTGSFYIENGVISDVYGNGASYINPLFNIVSNIDMRVRCGISKPPYFIYADNFYAKSYLDITFGENIFELGIMCNSTSISGSLYTYDGTNTVYYNLFFDEIYMNYTNNILELGTVMSGVKNMFYRYDDVYNVKFKVIHDVYNCSISGLYTSYIVFDEGYINKNISVDNEYYAIANIDNIDINTYEIFDVYDIDVYEDSIYRLQNKFYSYDMVYEFTTYNIQCTPITPFEDSITINASPNILPSDFSSYSNISVMVKDQYNNGMINKKVTVIDDDDYGFINKNVLYTDYLNEGYCNTIYTSGISPRTVKITATTLL